MKKKNFNQKMCFLLKIRKESCKENMKKKTAKGVVQYISKAETLYLRVFCMNRL